MPFDSEGYSVEPTLRPLAEPEAKTNLRTVRDFIAELPPERFNMSDFVGYIDGRGSADGNAAVALSDCGTAACIAGWACALLSPETDIWHSDDVASDLFGLSAPAADALFYPNNIGVARSADIEPAQAVRVLDHLIETGEVDWSKALEG